jgi:hypothetical protein
MRRYRIGGILVIALVIIVSIFYKVMAGHPDSSAASKPGTPDKVITLKGMIGSEKEALFNDADIKNIAQTKYHIVLDTYKAGSLEMTNPQNLKDNDFLFPASQTVVEKLKSETKVSGLDEIFRTPLVYYSWDKVAKALQSKSIVSQQADGSLTLDNTKLIDLIVNDKKWSDIGLEIYGPVVVDTSDPTKSNSGNSYAAIVATTLNQGHVITDATLPSVMPQLQKIFAKSGFKKASTTDLFNEYMTTGMGSHKIIVGYESDMLSFAQQNASVWKSLKSSVAPRILYPSATLWSTHTIVALTSNGKIMSAFLKDPEVQKIAWERYGFRSAIVGITNSPSSHDIEGVSKSIDNVMPFPDYITMEHLLAAFDANYQ